MGLNIYRSLQWIRTGTLISLISDDAFTLGLSKFFYVGLSYTFDVFDSIYM